MSTVYSAVDERLDRLVAVKVMSAGLSADPAFADRFTREARAAAKLAHINTVAVYDQGSQDTAHGRLVYLVMEMVSGRTLRDLLRERGRLTPAQAVSIMEPVLAALAVAHRAGLVHRDVKPENILLSDDGVVKVADFGLARAVGAEATTTQAGVMMGTVAYCSPEQVTRGNADQRSDVYSAGIVLYELLTGHAPYVGATAMAVAYQHVHSRVPAPSSQVPGIAAQLDDLVVRATDSDPAGRPRDAGAFLAELADVRAELNLPVVPVPVRTRPNGNQPYAMSATAAAPDVSTTQRLAPGSGVQHTAIEGAPAFAPVPLPQPAPPRGPSGQSSLAHRRRRRRGLLIIVVVFLLIGAGAGLTGWWLVAGRYTRVPSVGGETQAAALAALHRAGFNSVTISQTNDETVQKGQAVGTRPGAGSQVRRHRHLTLLISLGPKLYEIPQLRGKARSEATDALGKLPVQYTTTQRFDDNVPKDHVIATSPAAGTQVRAHTAVTLIVSSGPQLLPVPDVTGHSQDDATNELQNAGFDVNVNQQFSDSVDAGKVISQDPGAGSQVEKGHTVTITVSKGSETVTVPDIPAGTPLDQARATLEGAGLKVRVRSILRGGSGSVFQLDPPAGTQVHRGDTITVYTF